MGVKIGNITHRTAREILKPGGFVLKIDIDDPQPIIDTLNLGEDFRVELEKIFQRLVFEVHKYLIRVTPIDTGQLRGGWTGYLDTFQQDYSRQIFDTSLAIKARGRDYHIDPAEIQKGKAQSKWNQPDPLTVTLMNEVPYGFYLEFGTSKLEARNFTSLAWYKGELLFTNILTKWFEDIAKEGKIVSLRGINLELAA